MADDDAAGGESRLFTMRIWPERVGGVVEHRGSVRAVESGAFCSFRRWSDLTSFLVEQLDEGRSMNEDA